MGYPERGVGHATLPIILTIFFYHTRPPSWYNPDMSRGKTKKQVVSAAQKKAAAMPALRLDRKAREMIAHYDDHMDLEAAAEACGVTQSQLVEYQKNRDFMNCISKINNLAAIASDFNKTTVLANAAKTMRLLTEGVEDGEFKGANALVKLLEVGMQHHGMARPKEDASKGLQVNIQINLADGTKVVSGE